MVCCMCYHLEFFSTQQKLKQLCAHRCLSEWAVTTQQPLITKLICEYCQGGFVVQKYKKNCYNFKVGFSLIVCINLVY